jgi:Ser/Thr protein kinase RdoA (MazF antagonist)
VVFADIPLTTEIRAAVRRHRGLAAGGGERLYGGEESACYRLGGDVVRIGPPWRTNAELAWSYAVAAQAAAQVAEVAAPRLAQDGRLVVRVAGRPVSVWPYVPGAGAMTGAKSYAARPRGSSPACTAPLRGPAPGPGPVRVPYPGSCRR